MTRVVVTGMAGITALGHDWPSIKAAFADGRTAIRYMPEWERFVDVNTRLAAPVPDFAVPDHWRRKSTRTMGRVAQMAAASTEVALKQAGLLNRPVLQSGRTGVAYGSSFGSYPPVIAYAELMTTGHTPGLNATSYIQMMSHTAAVNIALMFGITGRIQTTCSACTSGSQAIGYAFESIRLGRADVMIAGGAEELDITEAAVFDTMYAASARNDHPSDTPRPYDVRRDGLVVGEGASTLVLEERDHALARGAPILAEVLGFGTNGDGSHATRPLQSTQAAAMQLALDDAGLPPAAIGFVSGHGTATEWGDIIETRATAEVLQAQVPIHSLKGWFGHTLGACGAMEAWLAIEMMNEDLFWPTANLTEVDPRCAPLDYLRDGPRRLIVEHLMSNNFAFGGINTSLVFGRVR